MSETLSAGAEGFTMSMLKEARSAADRPITMIVLAPAAAGRSTTLEEARERVRKAEVAERRDLADRFAKAAYDVRGVKEVRLTSDDQTLLVTVLTEGRDLERDLALQRRFADLARELPHIEWSMRSRPYGYDQPEADGELLPL